MKSLGLIGPEQTPFYVKKTKLGAPFTKTVIIVFIQECNSYSTAIFMVNLYGMVFSNCLIFNKIICRISIVFSYKSMKQIAFIVKLPYLER